MKRSLALAALALLLTSCSSPAATEEPATTSSAPTSESAAIDITDKLKDAAGNASITALLEDGRVTIETNLVDPRGEDGSPEAQHAIEICEAAAALDGVSNVNLYEADGTTWILFGHPMAEEGKCTEV